MSVERWALGRGGEHDDPKIISVDGFCLDSESHWIGTSQTHPAI